MNRDEKNLQTRQKIIDSAFSEFGKKSYNEASLNTVCSVGNISKGIIYHYFKDKDELYLVCVKECFDTLTKFLKNENFTFVDVQTDIDNYLATRLRFFKEQPNYSNIFFNTILHQPIHLQNQIKVLRSEFDIQSLGFYQAVVDNISLHKNISKDEAIEYFLIFQEMFNGYFQSETYKSTNFSSIAETHEKKLSKFLNIILYGIAEESTLRKKEL